MATAVSMAFPWCGYLARLPLILRFRQASQMVNLSVPWCLHATPAQLCCTPCRPCKQFGIWEDVFHGQAVWQAPPHKLEARTAARCQCTDTTAHQEVSVSHCNQRGKNTGHPAIYNPTTRNRITEPNLQQHACQSRALGSNRAVFGSNA